MRKLLSIWHVTMAVSLAVCRADTLTAVSERVARLAAGEDMVIQTKLYPQKAEAAVAFLEKARELADGNKRSRVLSIVSALMQDAKREDIAVFQSLSGRMLEMLVEYACTDKAVTVRSHAAALLRMEYFPLTDVDRYAAELAEAAGKWKEEEILILYGLLPSADSARVRSLVQEAIAPPQRRPALLLAILARHGDAAARDELLLRFRQVTPGTPLLHDLVSAICLAPTREVQTALAEGLRLPGVVEGQEDFGGISRWRDWYATALIRMMKGDPEFPLQREGRPYSDEQLDLIEAWCTKHLGVVFPGEPRPNPPLVAPRRPAPTPARLFGQRRSDTEDLVVLRNDEVLAGTVLDERVSIDTPYGLLHVPLRRCAGVSFDAEITDAEMIVTVNFNRYSGSVDKPIIHFRRGDTGTETAIRKEDVRHVLLRHAADERDFAYPTMESTLFWMANGDLLTGRTDPAWLELGADDAKVRIGFEEMDYLVIQGGGLPAAIVTRTDKGVVRGEPVMQGLTVQLDIGITTGTVAKEHVTRIVTENGNIHAMLVVGGIDQWGSNDSVLLPVIEEGGKGGDELVLTIPGPDEVRLRMRRIPAGTFVMGSAGMRPPRTDWGPIHHVTITKPFYMGIYEVTQAQWQAVMGTEPPAWRFPRGPKEGPNHPVARVHWLVSKEFIEKLNGLGLGTFRLPTEAEWEYACRAGTLTDHYWWNLPAPGLPVGWYHEGGAWSFQTREVGRTEPNPWGLYDMYGNVSEWCQDWYGPYTVHSKTDPQGPAEGRIRVARGGGILDTMTHCSSPSRRCAPNPRGFRLVREIE